MKIKLREALAVVDAWNRNDFAFLRGFFSALERARARGLINKYSAACDRIEAVFEQRFRLAAWPPEWPVDVVAEHRLRLASFISSVGLKPLLDDLVAADTDRHKPRNLKWFMFAAGRASRWDILIDQMHRARWEKQKSAESAPFNRTSAKSPTQLHTAWVNAVSEPKREIELADLFNKLLEASSAK